MQVARWERARGAGWGNKVVGGNRRRALRGYGGRTETPPAKLSACATDHGAAARGFNTKGHKERRDGMDRNTKIFWWGEK